MKFASKILWSMLLGAVIPCAMAADGNPVLRQFETSSPLGQQKATVYRDGSIHAVHTEKSMATEVNIRFAGRVAIIDTNNGIASGTTVIDLDAHKKWMSSDPAMASEIQGTVSWLKQRRKVTWNSQTTTASAGQCSSQLNDLLDAADYAVTTCANASPGLMCTMAVNDYEDAKTAYNNCMKVTGPSRQ